MALTTKVTPLDSYTETMDVDETRSAERCAPFTGMKIAPLEPLIVYPKGRVGWWGPAIWFVPKRHVANERGETREVSIEMLVEPMRFVEMYRSQI